MTSDTASQIAYLTRVLKAPTLRDSAERLAERARADSWTHQEYLAAYLETEGATRAAHGGPAGGGRGAGGVAGSGRPRPGDGAGVYR